MVSDMLELIDIDQIRAESLVRYKNVETVRRYFRRGILYPHQVNGVTLSSYRGSVITRYGSMERIKTIAYANGQRLGLDAIGDMFRKVGGEEDSYIISSLKEGKPVDEIKEAFTNMCKKEYPTYFAK
jgi:hypothetical protein